MQYVIPVKSWIYVYKQEGRRGFGGAAVEGCEPRQLEYRLHTLTSQRFGDSSVRGLKGLTAHFWRTLHWGCAGRRSSKGANRPTRPTKLPRRLETLLVVPAGGGERCAWHHCIEPGAPLNLCPMPGAAPPPSPPNQEVSSAPTEKPLFLGVRSWETGMNSSQLSFAQTEC